MHTKDTFEIFDTNLQQLDSLIEKNLFLNCHHACTDLTRYSVMSNYTDGLLVSEVLEGVFAQMQTMFDMYKIPDDEKRTITYELKDGINKIKNSYQDEDKNLLYNGLKKTRNDSTNFQMKCWNTFPRRHKIRRHLGESI